MLFDLENLNPAIKWYLDDDDKSQGSVTLRALSRDDVMENLKKHTKKTTEIHRGMQVVKEEISEESDYDSWDKSIVEWELFDKNNNPIPCTRDNKVLLMGKSPWFQNFVAERLERMRKEFPQEELEKNSQGQLKDSSPKKTAQHVSKF